MLNILSVCSYARRCLGICYAVAVTGTAVAVAVAATAVVLLVVLVSSNSQNISKERARQSDTEVSLTICCQCVRGAANFKTYGHMHNVQWQVNGLYALIYTYAENSL